MDKEFRGLSFSKKISIFHPPIFILDIFNNLGSGMLGLILEYMIYGPM